MTTPLIRLCLVLHNHQPVGNFDDVIEQAYEQSYRPFLDLFEAYPTLRISLHTSGPLLLWLEQRYPDYLDRLAQLVSEQRLEIVGGAFYEPNPYDDSLPRSPRADSTIPRLAHSAFSSERAWHVDPRTCLGSRSRE